MEDYEYPLSATGAHGRNGGARSRTVSSEPCPRPIRPISWHFVPRRMDCRVRVGPEAGPSGGPGKTNAGGRHESRRSRDGVRAGTCRDDFQGGAGHFPPDRLTGSGGTEQGSCKGPLGGHVIDGATAAGMGSGGRRPTAHGLPRLGTGLPEKGRRGRPRAKAPGPVAGGLAACRHGCRG